jgi:hypothetical protein
VNEIKHKFLFTGKQTINKFHFVMLVAKLEFTSDCQGRTGHSGKCVLTTGPFPYKMSKKGPFEGILGDF